MGFKVFCLENEFKLSYCSFGSFCEYLLFESWLCFRICSRILTTFVFKRYEACKVGVLCLRGLCVSVCRSKVDSVFAFREEI